MDINIKKNLYDLCQFLLSNNFFFKLKIDYISQNNLLTILNFHRINPNNNVGMQEIKSCFNNKLFDSDLFWITELKISIRSLLKYKQTAIKVPK